MSNHTDDVGSDNYYTILGVDRHASAQTIRKAYLQASLRWHPDKNPDASDHARQQFVRIGQAYQVLSDPQERAAYDRQPRQSSPASSYARHTQQPSSSSSSYSRTSQQQQYPPDQPSYDSFRAFFDATVASLSEEEVREVAGTAAMIGGLVGGLLGPRVLLGGSATARGTTTTTTGALVQGVGSLLGSLLAREAATALVETAHEQSRQRVAMDQERRERVARGEPPPRDLDLSDVWQDLWRGTARELQKKVGMVDPATMRRDGRR